MFLARQVLDVELVDREGNKVGKVDDLVLELQDDSCPVVRTIRWGRGTMASRLGFPLGPVGRWVRETVLGPTADDPPHEMAWNRVKQIDVAVHLECDRKKDDLLVTQDAIWNRWLKRMPWAER